MEGFQPKIVAFCCYYCAYSAADLAGSMRLQYPPTIRMIEQPCSGRIDIQLILRAFEDGADGVYVAGCLEGDCHFLKGNYRAKKRVGQAKKILEDVGLGGERVEMFNLSGSMGPRFAEVAHEFTERIRRLGPSPVKAGNSFSTATEPDIKEPEPLDKEEQMSPGIEGKLVGKAG